MRLIFAIVVALAVCAAAETVSQELLRAAARSVDGRASPRWTSQPTQCQSCTQRLNETTCLLSCGCGWCHASAGFVSRCLDVADAAGARPATCIGDWDSDASSNDCKLFPLKTVQGLSATLGLALSVVFIYIIVRIVRFLCRCRTERLGAHRIGAFTVDLDVLVDDDTTGRGPEAPGGLPRRSGSRGGGGGGAHAM